MDPLLNKSQDFEYRPDVSIGKNKKKRKESEVGQISKEQLIHENQKIDTSDKKISKKIKLGSSDTDISKKIKASRPHEFEEITSKKHKTAKPILKRTLSTPNLRETQLEHTRQEKIDAKSSHIWKCIDFANDKYGGEIYTFKLKPEFDKSNPMQGDNFMEEVPKIFPAVEQPAIYLDIMLNLSSTKELRSRIFRDFPDIFPFGQGIDELIEKHKSISKYAKELNSLGYGYISDQSGCYFKAPNREALIARWEKLRSKNPELPELDIVSSSGIADDISFVEAYFIHDALLSTGKEFIHDHQIHLIPTLCMILSLKNAENYQRGKFGLYKIIQDSYRKIIIAKNMLDAGIPNMAPEEFSKAKKSINQMEAALGAFVDELSAGPSIKENKKLIIDKDSWEKHISRLLADDAGLWDGYWERRFGKEALNAEQLKSLSNCVNNIAVMFTELRKKTT